MDERSEVTIELTLTEEEWCELVNALISKAVQIEQGRYGGREDPEDDARWAAVLRSACDKIAAALDEKGVY